MNTHEEEKKGKEPTHKSKSCLIQKKWTREKRVSAGPFIITILFRSIRIQDRFLPEMKWEDFR